MRVFVSVDLPREAVNEIERVQNELRKKNIFTGKFTEPENLHLTLKFLGEISVEDVDRVRENLKKVKFPGFFAYLGELGVFSSNFIRIIWAKVLGRQMEELQKEIDCALGGFFEKEERFMSHLTVARVKSVKDKKLLLNALKEIKVRNIGFEISEFYLMKSELKPGGPEYSVLEKFPLDEKLG